MFVVFFFFQNGASILGCDLFTTFTVYWSSRKFSWKMKQKVLLYEDIRKIWFVKPDTNMITMSFYEEFSVTYRQLRLNDCFQGKQ